MAERKRVNLLPITGQKGSNRAAGKSRETIRIRVQLPESTEDTCPIFSYKDEHAKALKRYNHEKTKEANGANGFQMDDMEEDDDVRRIARQMEEKYGQGEVKKKRKVRQDDYADIGMGYDESDSFIDNTDGYDEMVPHNVTTVHGGFYINSGALEFKVNDESNTDDSSDSTSDDDENDINSTIKPKNRKRMIESSDDEETDRENKTDSIDASKKATSDNNNRKQLPSKKMKLMQNGGNGVHQAVKKKLVNLGQDFVKKKKTNSGSNTKKDAVKALIREQCKSINLTLPNAYKSIDNIEISSDDGDIKTSVSDIIESVIKGSIDDKKTVVASDKLKKVESSQNLETGKPKTSEEIKLPENLSTDIVNVITAIKSCAKSSADGKSMFTGEVNVLILRLERKSKCLGKPSKLKVYGHLAHSLKCKTDVLMKKAKQLNFEDEQKILKNLQHKLQQEINKTMPVLLESYEKSQAIIQKRIAETPNADSEELKSLRMPKRRFQWNDTSRSLVKDIFQAKRRCLLLEGADKETIDAQILAFLKSKVQTLWPDGWMSSNALAKLYTTYSDGKQIGNGGKNPVQTFNHTNLSITPIVNVNNSSNSGVIETSVNLACSKKAQPTSKCDKPAEIECKLKVKPASELLANLYNTKNDSSSIINLIRDDGEAKTIVKQHKKAATEDANAYCQVIDLSEKAAKAEAVKKEVKIEHTVNKLHELSITPAYSQAGGVVLSKTSAGDDIQKVMEDLKVLQKMSSPKKTLEAAGPPPTSAPVSVIVNKSYAQKTTAATKGQGAGFGGSASGGGGNKMGNSYQEEFQKQLVVALNSHIPTSTSGKNNSFNSVDKFLTTSSNLVPSKNDDYFQNSNNNFTQSSNGHVPSTSQAGIYSILDDMYANFLTQYGYAKEATTPKSEPK